MAIRILLYIIFWNLDILRLNKLDHYFSSEMCIFTFCGQHLYIFMGYNVLFCYMCILHNDKKRIITIPIILHLYHFFVVRIFKIHQNLKLPLLSLFYYPFFFKRRKWSTERIFHRQIWDSSSDYLLSNVSPFWCLALRIRTDAQTSLINQPWSIMILKK